MFFFDRKSSIESPALEIYVGALNYLIEGNHEKALDYLKRSVHIDTNNIDAYIKLGILYRKIGQSARAYRIHKELTVRPNLTKNIKLDIFQNMVLDLKELGDFEKSLQYTNKILEIDKKKLWAWKQKILLYELLQDWVKRKVWLLSAYVRVVYAR